jgi:DNA polymerase-3 subunit gamma/tau
VNAGPAAQSAEAADQVALAAFEAGHWPAVLDQLGLGGIVLNIASHCALRQRNGEALEFVLDQDNAALFNPGHVAQLRGALERYFGTGLTVEVTPGLPPGETPAQRDARLAEERRLAAVDAIERDPRLRSLINRFDGELDRGSIQPIGN